MRRPCCLTAAAAPRPAALPCLPRGVEGAQLLGRGVLGGLADVGRVHLGPRSSARLPFGVPVRAVPALYASHF